MTMLLLVGSSSSSLGLCSCHNLFSSKRKAVPLSPLVASLFNLCFCSQGPSLSVPPRLPSPRLSLPHSALVSVSSSSSVSVSASASLSLRRHLPHSSTPQRQSSRLKVSYPPLSFLSHTHSLSSLHHSRALAAFPLRMQSKGIPSLSASEASGVPGRAYSASSSSADADADAEMSQRKTQKENRLAQEHSPYLLQHAHNPVEWYPWGEEAFERAREEDKPIFLSVGYSTCHWCHVMERESFESEEVAAIMNEAFINIKVDREERPDVDKVYMTYVQATQGGGGWPMSVFLTPSLHPVLGGTYFPPEDRYGRIGFKTLLRRVQKVWKERRQEMEEAGRDVIRQLMDATDEGTPEASRVVPGTSQVLIKCCSQLESRFDSELGGFGSAPKFPRPSELNALLRRYHWGRQYPNETTAGAEGAGGKEGAGEQDKGAGEKQGRHALEMAKFTLRCMGRGGMHDHVGGGFHRYSVDEFWHVPHFEKMLYDQGQLASSYLDAFAVSGNELYATDARDILDYVLRDLSHPDGGFYSAEDADSLEENQKKEGAFYVWSTHEVEDILGKESKMAKLVMQHYYVKEEGNCDLSPRSDPQKEFKGKNCLIQRHSLEHSSSALSLSVEEAASLLEDARKLLHSARSKRPRPNLDDKVIVAWNGLMISAMARASHILTTQLSHSPYYFPVTGCQPMVYLEAAVKAAEFVRENLYNPNTKQLKRSFRNGPSEASGFADDYAFFISALLDLFEASGGDTHWLQWAMDLQSTQDTLFWDNNGGGYYSTPEGDASILLRLKEDYDGAEPSANSYAIANLARLSHYVGGEQSEEYKHKAEKTAAAFHDRLMKVPLALPQMCAFLPLLGEVSSPRQVVIVGKKEDTKAQSLLTAALSSSSPDKIVIPVDPTNEDVISFWAQHNPMVLGVAGVKKEEDVRGIVSAKEAAAFVCQNFTCLVPTSSPDALKKILDEPQRVSKTSITEMRL